MQVVSTLCNPILGLLDAPENLCVEEDESTDRDDTGENKSAPVLVVSKHVDEENDEEAVCTEYSQDSSLAQ